MAAGALDAPLDALRRQLDGEIGRGIETGVQITVSHRGDRRDLAFGENGNGHAMTTGTWVPWTCSSKPLGALAFAGAWDDGALGLDTRVADVLPDFTGGGKEDVRVRDLLTHTTGMDDPVMAIETDGAELPSFEEVDGLLWLVVCAATTRVKPGTQMIYNPVTNWFVVDRLLNTVHGAAPGDSYRTMFSLLGLGAALGKPEEAGPGEIVEVVATEDQKDGLERMNLASLLPLPGVGVWGTMRDLCTVGEVLLRHGDHDGTRVARPSSVEALTATQWPGGGHRSVCDTDFPYGLGLMTLPAIFGRRCSFRTYGHAGGNTSTLLVDPLFDLVVAVYWNGRLSDVKTVARRHALVRALYGDLGLSTAATAAP